MRIYHLTELITLKLMGFVDKQMN